MRGQRQTRASESTLILSEYLKTILIGFRFKNLKSGLFFFARLSLFHSNISKFGKNTVVKKLFST
jgi:hypothetical protein